MNVAEKRVPAVELDGHDAVLLYAASERSPDLYWACDLLAPDPFHYLCDGQRAWVLVKDLELDRAREQSCCEVLAYSQYESEPAAGDGLRNALRELGFRRLLVPADFPLATAESLRNEGFAITAAAAPLFPERAIKTPAQIEAVAAAQRAAAIVDGVLHAEGGPLTSEQVRSLIHHTLLDLECTAHHTIVAGGQQAIDPHQAGHGPLPAHEPIIIDIFPRSDVTGYFGDITRTFVRGEVSSAVQRLYETVLAAQQQALDAVRAGAEGAQIHEHVQRFFEDAGYETGEIDGRMQGYFHGTGHGVGLEIHEAPSLGRRSSVLAAGHTLTVEPGLYYAGVGGVRIEDLVIVEEGGHRNLTSFPKSLRVAP